MKNLKSIVLGLGLTATFVLAGCGSDGMAELEKGVDKICACKDSECVKKATADLEKTLKGKDKPTSESDLKKLGELTTKMMKCSTDIAMKEVKGATEAK